MLKKPKQIIILIQNKLKVTIVGTLGISHQIESVSHLSTRKDEACHQIAQDPKNGYDCLSDAFDPENQRNNHNYL